MAETSVHAVGPQSPESLVPFDPADPRQSIPRHFEAQVRRHPQRTALCTHAARLSFSELNAAANRLAGGIVAACGVAPEPVALLFSDDVGQVTAMLAALKAGKFYVPLDRHHPPARLAQIVADSTARLLVTDAALEAVGAAVAGTGTKVLEAARASAGLSDEDPDLPIGPDALAHVLYTSGSTGQPKGVVHTHGSAMHNVLRYTGAVRVSHEDRILLLGARSAGQFISGVYSALLNGAGLYPYRVREDGLAGLAAWIAEREITVYNSSASTFRYFAEALDQGFSFPKLRLVRLGSEPVTRRDLSLFREHFPPSCVFLNALSSTETGMMRQQVVPPEARISGSLVPAGYAVPDVDVLVLDREGRELGAGEVGEIAVRSRYLALGYWRCPDLTDAAFRPDPAGGGGRIFLTGDLGRLASDGCLEHLGRKDSFVKIRGNRVELAEVEATLLEAPGIRSALVIARQEGHDEPRLVAYVVPTTVQAPPVAAWRRFLASRVPDFMVPSVFLALPELPTLPNGKVDRAALPAPGDAGRAAGSAGVPPRTILETQLQRIWDEVLGVPAVGVTDDFFELGGDSLLVTRMFHHVEQECGRRVTPASLLPGLTIEHLASALMAAERDRAGGRLVTLQAGDAPVTLVFLHGDHESGGFYCVRLARSLGGDQTFLVLHPHGLDDGAVPASVEAMAADHVRALREAQLTGPIVLGGFCNGGVIAFEMACQMQAQGMPVAAVLLIDARAVNVAHRSLLRAVRMAGLALRLTASDQQRWFRRLQWYQADIASMDGPVAWRWMRLLARKLRVSLMGTADVAWQSAADRDVVESAAQSSLWQLYHDRLAVYVPARFRGRVALFRSRHVDNRPPFDRSKGWSAVADEVTVHDLPGDHRECVTVHVAELARLMRPYLDEPGQAHLRADAAPSPWYSDKLSGHS